MGETINELISVNFISQPTTRYPSVIVWRGRRYTVTKVGLHHTVRHGSTLYHIFSVTDGTTFFKLQFNTETLIWKLLEVDS